MSWIDESGPEGSQPGVLMVASGVVSTLGQGQTVDIVCPAQAVLLHCQTSSDILGVLDCPEAVLITALYSAATMPRSSRYCFHDQLDEEGDEIIWANTKVLLFNRCEERQT
jgi:hypothetical protein